jgi:hypothetical protein
MPDFLLLGTDHRYQFSDPSISKSDILAFEQLIITTCESCGVNLIAEEMSLDALNIKQLSESIPASIAKRLKLPHLYCDPPVSEQLSLGIADENAIRAILGSRQTAPEEIQRFVELERRKREPVWLKNIEANAIWPVMFIFGSWHSQSFAELLSDHGHSYAFIHSAWRA